VGNDQPEVGYGTEYLWKEILQPDNFLRILAVICTSKSKSKKTHSVTAEERDDDLSPLPSVGSGAENFLVLFNSKVRAEVPYPAFRWFW
jgi:hypothetical protein